MLFSVYKSQDMPYTGLTSKRKETPTLSSQEHYFNNHMPDSLYMNHYELALHFNEYSPEQWRQFLRDNDKFIMKEVAAITEAEARKALQKLSTGKLSAQEVSAIKQILDRSEQINKQSQDARTFITTHMPKLTPEQSRLQVQEQKELLKQTWIINQQKVNTIYNPTIDFYQRIQKGEIIPNDDGTITIPKPKRREDFLYLGIEIPELSS